MTTTRFSNGTPHNEKYSVSNESLRLITFDVYPVAVKIIQTLETSAAGITFGHAKFGFTSRTTTRTTAI